ncbi:MAG: hypothetical protein A2Z27_05805 [candidate division Zixibacteria bacterium RBG_16_50_21]|nr:MAG: hypothetical protein A2Z27_05805 [candidate division Zixibacteria bacterium RBG_16_50_21]
MRFRSLVTAVLFLTLIAAAALAQKKEQPNLNQNQPTLKINHAKTDTVWFEFKQQGKQLTADLMLFSDQPIAGGSIPVKFGNGKAPLSVDSVVFDAKRAGRFDIRNDGVDDSVNIRQAIRLGFIADLSGRKPPLEAGRGKLLTLYFTLKTDRPYEVVLDTTTMSGGYQFQLVDPAAGTIPAAFKTGKFKTK